MFDRSVSVKWSSAIGPCSQPGVVVPGRLRLPTTSQQFQGFQRAHSPCNMGLAATTWIATGARVPGLSLNDDPNPVKQGFRGYTRPIHLHSKAGHSAQSAAQPSTQPCGACRAVSFEELKTVENFEC